MIIVWRFLDGNRAHEKQSAALVAGLEANLGAGAVQTRNIDCTHLRFWRPADLTRALDTAGVVAGEAPQLLIGAGHRCHLPMLSARRRFGGRTVVLMRPSLPLHWFDFALIPEHDRPAPLPNVLVTRGALTVPLADAQPIAGRGLILLGGPSKHFAWDNAALGRDIDALATTPVQWTLADSRRTPEFALEQLARPGFDICSWSDCEAGWLESQIASCEQIWVTRDSISMVFEALQGRAQVGILDLPSRRPRNKVRAAVQRLVDEGVVTDDLADAAHAGEGVREPWAQHQMAARALLRRCNIEVCR
ncbi:ELM1/GtrOC1 family putative glycosyltransferase [Microbulbifer sp. YPW1]|uniref:ELM1/GtrOC1 family putative glycosyltransferase n=1 Tax=Microbulbifer sp. YPW1 TaxID=2745199 RepID=UPI00159AB76D|nr:ELM1/GtrOC1 family putative glycosyltransferase [Microbulbifer sp. YPW1]QKX16177.1 mitochondrial fission ELM1 family protein [Microbulbifer sp. YPW1]